MPELNFPEKDSPDSAKHVELMAVMAYPNDKNMRNQFKANYASKYKNEPALIEDNSELSPEIWREIKTKTQDMIFKDLDRVFISSGGEPSLYNSPGYEKTINECIDNQNKGLIAGRILHWIMAISNSKEKVSGGASVNKAIFLIEYYLKFKNSSIRRSWREFKPVSHFWATFEFWKSQGEPEEWSPYLNTDIFLVHTEGFREFGTRYFSIGQSKPILSPEDIWLPPKHLQPDENGRMEIKNNFAKYIHLSSEILEVLKEYRAPQNKNP